jgi:undecaprenyl-diphosphatase
MDWLNALIMGVVQGLAEYLPISSSGHLEIFRELLGLDLTGAESLEFDVLLHVATVLSTIVILWREFVPLCVDFFTFKRGERFDYVLKILISCIPIGIVGVCFKDSIEQFFGEGLTVVGVCLCITALLLAFSYFFRTRPALTKSAKPYTPRDITWLDAFIIGCAQMIAVLPGLSRSGTTIATGIIIGNKREQVAQFSFLMVIIPILGEALLDIKDLLTEGSTAVSASIGFMPMLVGFLAAFIVGCCACKWMIELVKRGKLIWFAVYCLVVGLICILKGF